MDAPMKSTTLLAAGLAALVVFGGTAVALPGNAPVDANANNAAETAPERGPNDDRRAGGAPDAAANGSDRSNADAAGERGPPDDLPSQVPDHVSEIHDLIRQHLSGDLTGSLGDAISEVTPGGDDDDSDAADDDGESATDDSANVTDESNTTIADSAAATAA